MLQTGGQIFIPENPALEIRKTTKGYYFNFIIISPEIVKDPKTNKKNLIANHYRASMWVPEAEKAEWENCIVTGESFLVQNAFWQAHWKEGSKGPYNVLKLDRNFFTRIGSNMGPILYQEQEST